MQSFQDFLNNSDVGSDAGDIAEDYYESMKVYDDSLQDAYEQKVKEMMKQNLNRSEAIYQIDLLVVEEFILLGYTREEAMATVFGESPLED